MKKKTLIMSLPGAKPVGKAFSDKLIRQMSENAVPEVVRNVQQRQLLAAQARLKVAKRRP